MVKQEMVGRLAGDEPKSENSDELYKSCGVGDVSVCLGHMLLCSVACGPVKHRGIPPAA